MPKFGFKGKGPKGEIDLPEGNVNVDANLPDADVNVKAPKGSGGFNVKLPSFFWKICVYLNITFW